MSAHHRPIAYYISTHGYGHGVRSCDIIRAIKLDQPERPIHIISGLAPDFFRTRLGYLLNNADPLRQAAFDVGMVQSDAISTDVEATRQQILALCAQANELIRAEQDYLKNHRIATVVADIPGIPLAAAKRAGIPAIAAGNFSWDWVYEPFLEEDSRWLPAVEHFRECYADADLLLELPFSCGMSAFRHTETIPLLAVPGRDRRRELAEHTGAAIEKTWVLLSFVSLRLESGAIQRLQRLTDYEFFVVEPFNLRGKNIHPLSPKLTVFTDILTSMDVVVSKPGFGIVSECVANAKPLIYAERANYREEAVLVTAIQRYLRHARITPERLHAGDLAEAIERLTDQPAPVDRVETGGAAIAASRIVHWADDEAVKEISDLSG